MRHDAPEDSEGEDLSREELEEQGELGEEIIVNPAVFSSSTCNKGWSTIEGGYYLRGVVDGWTRTQTIGPGILSD